MAGSTTPYYSNSINTGLPIPQRSPAFAPVNAGNMNPTTPAQTNTTTDLPGYSTNTAGYVGYTPQYAGQIDQILSQLLQGGGGVNNPFLSSLQQNAQQSIRGAQAARGTYNAGFSAPEEARYMTDVYANQQNQQVQDLLSYLGITRPQPLAPQQTAPGAGDYLAQGLGAGLPIAAVLPFLL